MEDLATFGINETEQKYINTIMRAVGLKSRYVVRDVTEKDKNTDISWLQDPKEVLSVACSMVYDASRDDKTIERWGKRGITSKSQSELAHIATGYLESDKGTMREYLTYLASRVNTPEDINQELWMKEFFNWLEGTPEKPVLN